MSPRSGAAEDVARGPERREAALRAAVERFNAGAYKEALDLFEVPYHECDEAERPLFLGLVRASAALHHLERGHPASVRRLGSSALELLGTYAPVALGLDLGAFLAELEQALAEPSGAAGSAPKARRPRLAGTAR